MKRIREMRRRMSSIPRTNLRVRVEASIVILTRIHAHTSLMENSNILKIRGLILSPRLFRSSVLKTLKTL